MSHGERDRRPALGRGAIQNPQSKIQNLTAWCFTICTLLLPACAKPAAPPPATASDSAERGPFKLNVTIAPSEVWFGDPVNVEMHMATPEGYVVQFPAEAEFAPLEAQLGPPAEPRPAASGGVEWRQTITVFPLSGGTLEIPPIVVKYAQQSADAAASPRFDQELATGSLKVQVKSALTTQDSVAQPRDITGTLLPPQPINWKRIAAIAAGIAVALAAAVMLVVLLLRRLARPAPPMAPEVWALRAMNELAAADLIGSGRIRDYYYRLSEIVRGYIERKFGLAAPEMTTEEFLRILARDGSAVPYDTARLGAFLDACDIVKYAAFSPPREAAEDALSTARAFVHATSAAGEVSTGQSAGSPPVPVGGPAR